MPATEYKTTHPKTRKQWRQWLERNHATSPGIWLIYYKKSTGKAKVTYDDAVEEALCFGWIDSTKRPLDEDRFMQRFTPRKPKSGWSGPNKERIKKIIEKGLMTDAGKEKIEEAKKDGSWQSLDKIYMAPDRLEIPDDLEKAFLKNNKAKANFSVFPVFARRQLLQWISSAKQPQTRTARIKQTLLMATANKKPAMKGSRQ